ncbi:hypothetical protein ADL01_15050 [Streptomyces sp. NRRL WC-3618]|nr:hypothetical protein ADL01_15050 [Streptomyces sp. NRRL WC-3618]
MATRLALGDHCPRLGGEVDTELDRDLIGTGLAQLVECGASRLRDRRKCFLQRPGQLTNGLAEAAGLHRSLQHTCWFLDQNVAPVIQRKSGHRCQDGLLLSAAMLHAFPQVAAGGEYTVPFCAGTPSSVVNSGRRRILA